VSEQEQTRRLRGASTTAQDLELSPMDVDSYSRWYDYSRARDEMFKATDSSWAPWYVVNSNDKNRARLNLISHLLTKIRDKKRAAQEVKLPSAANRTVMWNRIIRTSNVAEKF